MNRGIYIGKFDPQSLDFLGRSRIFDFIWTASEDKKSLSLLKKGGYQLFYPLGIFSCQDNEEWRRYWAIGKSGKPIEIFAGWYRGACPSNSRLRKIRLAKIEKIFQDPYYDGVWLDTIRYPTYWETNKPEYLDTCYCKECLKKFSQSKQSWEKFRITQIESFLEEINKVKGKKILGYFAVPETPAKLQKVFAQPPEIFSRKVDFASPMIYPQMVGKDLSWVRKTIKYFQKFFGKKRTMPIIQLVKMPDDSPDKFTATDARQLTQTVSRLGPFGYFMLDQVIGREDEFFKPSLSCQ